MSMQLCLRRGVAEMEGHGGGNTEKETPRDLVNCRAAGARFVLRAGFYLSQGESISASRSEGKKLTSSPGDLVHGPTWMARKLFQKAGCDGCRPFPQLFVETEEDAIPWNSPS